jgi:hypothetical protein
MRAADLTRKLEERPFTPFRIHMSDGTTYDVNDAGMLLVGMSSAILPVKFGKDEEGRRIVRDWRTLAISHMVQFSDLKERGNGQRRKAS